MQQHEGCPTARKVADVQAAAIPRNSMFGEGRDVHVQFSASVARRPSQTKQGVPQFRTDTICHALKHIGEAVKLLTMCPFQSSFPSTRHANGFGSLAGSEAANCTADETRETRKSEPLDWTRKTLTVEPHFAGRKYAV
jgi:hypothetical protein